MIADLKPYPAIKDSGVSWLGEVPEHWEVFAVRRLFRAVSRKDIRGDEPKMSMSRHLGLVRSTELGSRSSAKSASLAYSVCHPTDLVMNKYQAHAGQFGCAIERGLITPNYTVFSPSKLAITSYYAELFRSHPYRAAFQMESYGIGDGMAPLYTNVFYRIPAVVPPLPEQAAIVRFLDHADRRIRQYIRAKQKLIKLLEEQKQAIIHRAVTRGHDPNVRLKPSGVEWLGDVPEHWEVARLKSLVSRVTSGSRGWSNFAADSGVLFIRIGNLTRASLDLDLESSVRLQLPQHVLGEAARTRVQRDDILLSITAFIGSVAVVPRDIETAYVSQHVACCRPRVGAANARWVGYVLLSHVGQTHGQLSMYGGTKQGLSLDDVRNYVVLIPPVEEQDRLVNWIDGAMASVDAGVRSTRREIALLREYRTRLIADVVTGKLDVREAAARLPDEVEEPEPLDEIEVEGDIDEAGADDIDAVPAEAEA